MRPVDSDEKAAISSIAVVRALNLGDLLCAVPALRSLRAGFPGARITLVGLPWAREFAWRFVRYLDGFVEFRGFPGIPERDCDPREVPAFLRDLQQGRFDLALQMHGSGTVSNAFVSLMSARETAGFYLPGHYCPDEARYLPYAEEEPQVRRWLRLVASLGCPPAGEHLEFPLAEADARSLDEIAGVRALREQPYACIHPGARCAERRWGVQEFALTADALSRRGLQVVLTGSAEERPLVDAVATAMGSRALPLAGRTSLGALACLIAGARLVVCNDTGVSHLADALRAPSVVVFTGSDPDEWAPLDRDLHRPVVQRPSALHTSRLAGVRRADDETLEVVLAEADDLLCGGGGHAA